jgi:carbonic anhydrase
MAHTGCKVAVKGWPAPLARTTVDDMRHFDELLANNARFAGTDARTRTPDIPFLPNRQIYVITCIDPRVDPSPLLELNLGDAVVARNVGGRVTPSVPGDLAWISFLHEVKTPDADWFELVVIHHTDCGSGLMADDELRRAFSRRGFADDELCATAVTDPYTTVVEDVRRVLDDPHVSAQIKVSSYVYDVHTGRLSEVIAPTRGRGTSKP